MLQLSRELWERCLHKDSEGLEKLHQVCQRLMAGLHSRYGLPSGEVDDLASAFYLFLCEDECHRLRRHDPVRSFGSWLHTAARHFLIDEARSRAATPAEVSIDSGGSSDLDLRAREETEAAALAQLSAEELLKKMRKALDILGPCEREAFIQHAVQERSYGEIAADLQVDVSAVRMRCSRARKRLQSLLRQSQRP